MFVLLLMKQYFADPMPKEDLPSIMEELSPEGTLVVDTHQNECKDDEYLSPMDNVKLDRSACNFCKPWCPCNVVLIETHQRSSRRIDLGRVHVDAWLGSGPVLSRS